jgi:hypothetical protein
LLTVSRSFMNVANSVLWRMAILLKANKVNFFVSSVLFVFWHHSPNFLDTPRTNNRSNVSSSLHQHLKACKNKPELLLNCMFAALQRDTWLEELCQTLTKCLGVSVLLKGRSAQYGFVSSESFEHFHRIFACQNANLTLVSVSLQKPRPISFSLFYRWRTSL